MAVTGESPLALGLLTKKESTSELELSIKTTGEMSASFFSTLARKNLKFTLYYFLLYANNFRRSRKEIELPNSFWNESGCQSLLSHLRSSRKLSAAKPALAPLELRR